MRIFRFFSAGGGLQESPPPHRPASHLFSSVGQERRDWF